MSGMEIKPKVCEWPPNTPHQPCAQSSDTNQTWPSGHFLYRGEKNRHPLKNQHSEGDGLLIFYLDFLISGCPKILNSASVRIFFRTLKNNLTSNDQQDLLFQWCPITKWIETNSLKYLQCSSYPCSTYREKLTPLPDTCVSKCIVKLRLHKIHILHTSRIEAFKWKGNTRAV